MSFYKFGKVRMRRRIKGDGIGNRYIIARIYIIPVYGIKTISF